MNGEKETPRVEVIDDRHQKFNGLIYTKDETGHYQNVLAIHRAVYNYFFDDIPSYCVIHHLDCNKDNNDITNLAMMTRKEHNRLHLDPNPLALEAFMEAHRERLEKMHFSVDAPKVEIIDAEHQKFNGMVFYKVKARGHYHHKLAMQRVVWTYFNGEIPDDDVYHIHHIDGNTDNNNIENLALITRSEHGKIHAPQFVEAIKARAEMRRAEKALIDNTEIKARAEMRRAEKALIDNTEIKARAEVRRAKKALIDNTEIRECVICHAEFSADKKSTKQTCSPSCTSKLQWQRQLSEENLIKKVCINCGKDFTTPFERTGFCSHGCARQFRNRKDKSPSAVE